MNGFVQLVNSLLPEPQASLLNGILFGIRGNFDASLYQNLVATGTLHIIALSGMNITILINLAARISLFLGRKKSSILTIIFIGLFVKMVGPSPTIIRAAIMGSLSLLAIYFGRRYYALLGLILASIIMLTFDFSLKNNLSFQLSFLATLGIILANGMGDRQKKILAKPRLTELIFNPIKENFKITLAAQVLTLPVILYNFHRISIIAPLANLLIEWTIQPIMVLGFITIISGSLFRPLGILPAWFTWVPLTYLIRVIEWLGNIPGATFKF